MLDPNDLVPGDRIKAISKFCLAQEGEIVKSTAEKITVKIIRGIDHRADTHTPLQVFPVAFRFYQKVRV